MIGAAELLARLRLEHELAIGPWCLVARDAFATGMHLR